MNNNINSPTSPSKTTKQMVQAGMNLQNLNKSSHARNKRSLHNYRFLKNNFMQNQTYTEESKLPVYDLSKLPTNQTETTNINNIIPANRRSKQIYNSTFKGNRRGMQQSFETKPVINEGLLSQPSLQSNIITSPRNQILSPSNSNQGSQNFRTIVKKIQNNSYSRVRQGNQQPQMLMTDRKNKAVDQQALSNQQIPPLENQKGQLQLLPHKRQQSDYKSPYQILSARNNTNNQSSKRNLVIQQSQDRLQKVEIEQNNNGLYTSRRRNNQLGNKLSNESFNSDGVKTNLTSSYKSFQKTPQKRRNMVIEEASEREELTVQDMVDNKIELPVSSSEAIIKYKEDYLSDIEINEIVEFSSVYYLSYKENKIKPTKAERLVNNGFDDADGYYRIVNGDQLGYRYQILEQIGKGAFGQVLRCFDHKDRQLVAMKMVKNQKKYYYQAAVEAKLLLLLKENDQDAKEHVIKIKEYFVFRNHLCMTFDLFSINLYEFIKMHDYSGFNESLIRRFGIQILSGLKYLKQLGMIHCDLKPENILLKSKDKSGLVIADFGSGTLDNEIVYTYIQSRFYRAPDIMLGLFPYSQGIDMWSFGCILIELFTGFPLFPGTNEREQLQLIIDVIGMPPVNVLQVSTRKHLFSQFKDSSVPAPSEVLTQEQKEERLKYIMIKLKGTPDDCLVNLIGQCLEWDPKKRIQPENGLKHEWILKGLPPKVLIQHSKAQRISSTELPVNARKVVQQEYKASNQSIKQYLQSEKSLEKIQSSQQQIPKLNSSYSKGYQQIQQIIVNQQQNQQQAQVKNINNKQLLRRILSKQ